MSDPKTETLRQNLKFAGLYSLKPAITELERFYVFLNKKHKLGLPSNVVITIQSKGRKKALAWFKPNAWENGKEPLIHEINIAAEHLADHPYESLAHEVAHLLEVHKSRKMPTCNYHTAMFKKYAEMLGLKVGKMKGKGWASTSEGEPFEKALKEFKPEQKVFELVKQLPEQLKQPTRMVKYECDCTIVRCATELEAECTSCGEPFEEGE